MSVPILVVEDEPNLRRTLARVLMKDGYDVSTAPDGAVALKMLESNYEPLAIVSDCDMPDLDGRGLLERLPLATREKIIFFTDTRSDRLDGLPNTVIRKPDIAMLRIELGQRLAPRADIRLSTGKVIKHERMANGAQRAEPGMTDDEWLEYCEILNGLLK